MVKNNGGEVYGISLIHLYKLILRPIMNLAVYFRYHFRMLIEKYTVRLNPELLSQGKRFIDENDILHKFDPLKHYGLAITSNRYCSLRYLFARIESKTRNNNNKKNRYIAFQE